jgi:hypothetical protein
MANAKLVGTALATSIVCSNHLALADVNIDAGSSINATASDGTPYSADPSDPNTFWDYGTYANLCSDGAGHVSIAGTANPNIYQTVRASPNFSYSIPVPNGCYDIDLKFVECSNNQTGHRLMSVNINGSTVLTGLDIFAQAGAARALHQDFSGIVVNNGSLSMNFRASTNGENAVISGFDIWASNDCSPPPAIQHILVIILENTKASDALAQPYLGGLVNGGWSAYLGNYQAVTHPSQPNYLAMVAGDTFGITDDNNHNINASHLGDLLEAKGLSWKIYSEDYPGNCFTGASSGNYARKHNPFISFTNIHNNAARCNAHVVNANQFWTDQQNGQLPTVAFYVPNQLNDGHDTGVAYADNWLSSTFGPLFSSDAWWTINPLVVITFDEDDAVTNANQVYTALFGTTTRNGTISEVNYNHYSLLRLIESTFNLGNLGRNDVSAPQIIDIWN